MSELSQLAGRIYGVAIEIDSDLENMAYTAANVAETTAKDMCPRDTGVLQNSITADVYSYGTGFELSSDVDYAIFVDRGHVTRNGSKFIPGTEMFRSGMEDAMIYLEDSIDDIYNELDRIFS